MCKRRGAPRARAAATHARTRRTRRQLRGMRMLLAHARLWAVRALTVGRARARELGAQIRGYPTLKAFFNGREVDTHQARSCGGGGARRSARGCCGAAGAPASPRADARAAAVRARPRPQGQRELPALRQFVVSSISKAGK